MPQWLVGLDAGTSKTAVVVGEQDDTGGLEIVGCGIVDSRGIHGGQVTFDQAAADTMRQAVDRARSQAGVDIDEVYISVSGPRLEGVGCRGTYVVENRDHAVTGEDVRRAIDAAVRSVPCPDGREILHVAPSSFIADEQDGVAEPRRFIIQRGLTANVHLVTGPTSVRRSLIECAHSINLTVVGSIVGAVAASEAVLTSADKAIGVAMIDIGSSSTQIAVFENGHLQHTAVVPVGGAHFTHDFVMVLCLPVPEAERLKRSIGSVLPESIDSEEVVNVPRPNSTRQRVYARRELATILHERANELFGLVRVALANSGYDDGLFAGVVLTGGGALLAGMPEIAARILARPVRLGCPMVSGERADQVGTPRFSTAVGLVLCAHLRREGVYRPPRPMRRRFSGYTG